MAKRRDDAIVSGRGFYDLRLNFNEPPKRFTRLLQVDGETEQDDLTTADFVDRWDDTAWENLICWQGTLAQIGPSEQTLSRFEDDGGQPAPEIERRSYSMGVFTRGFYILGFPTAVRR